MFNIKKPKLKVTLAVIHQKLKGVYNYTFKSSTYFFSTSSKLHY